MSAFLTAPDPDLNVYVNVEVPEAETCPGEFIDLSSWTPGSGSSIAITGGTEAALDDIDEPTEIPCWRSTATREHVYYFNPPEDLNLQIDIVGSSFDTNMAIVSPCPSGDDFCIFIEIKQI